MLCQRSYVPTQDPIAATWPCWVQDDYASLNWPYNMTRPAVPVVGGLAREGCTVRTEPVGICSVVTSVFLPLRGIVRIPRYANSTTHRPVSAVSPAPADWPTAFVSPDEPCLAWTVLLPSRAFVPASDALKSSQHFSAFSPFLSSYDRIRLAGITELLQL